MKNDQETLKAITRRHFFRQAGTGVGMAALAALLGDEAALAAAPPAPHFPAKAKRVIYLFMAGAPSQIDLFDNKPKLVQYNGQSIPEEIIKGERFAFIKGTPKLLGSPHAFARHGKSGQEISALLPHLASVADDIAIVRSAQTDQFNHAPAQIFCNTGHALPGRPAMGSWLTYGLGSENRALPGFVVLLSGPVSYTHLTLPTN